MDTQSLIWLWVLIIIVALVLGGPVLMLLGMFFMWLLPGIIVGGLILLLFRSVGKSMDRHG